MQVGQVPGMMSSSVASSSTTTMDQEHPIQVNPIQSTSQLMSSKAMGGTSRSSSSTGAINKPKLLRTISSMDDTILQELTRECCSISPDSTTTSYFKDMTELNPRPTNNGSNNQRPNVSSRADSCPSMSFMPFIREQQDNSPSSFDTRDETVISTQHKHNTTEGVLNSKDIPKPNLNKRNSCGTLYVRNTMAAPDKEAAIKVKEKRILFTFPIVTIRSLLLLNTNSSLPILKIKSSAFVEFTGPTCCKRGQMI